MKIIKVQGGSLHSLLGVQHSEVYIYLKLKTRLFCKGDTKLRLNSPIVEP